MPGVDYAVDTGLLQACSSALSYPPWRTIFGGRVAATIDR